MPKYKVSMQELAFYTVRVEADNEEDARTIASTKFNDGDYESDGFDDRQTTEVVEDNAP